MGKNNLEDIFLAEAAEKTIKNKNKKGFDLKTECIWTGSFWEHRRLEIQHNFQSHFPDSSSRPTFKTNVWIKIAPSFFTAKSKPKLGVFTP